jgi:hypothetical protein
MTGLFCLGKCNMSITVMPKIQCSSCFCFYQSLYVPKTSRLNVILYRLLRQLGTFRPGLAKVGAQMVTYFVKNSPEGRTCLYIYRRVEEEGGVEFTGKLLFTINKLG